jgi:predicted nuclease with TOPRIM domain
MTTGIWIAFGFFWLVIAVALVWAGYQALRVWRELRKMPKGVLGQLEDIAHDAAVAQERVAKLEVQVADLTERVESLNASLERARILMGAAGEVRSLVDSARSFIPTK